MASVSAREANVALVPSFGTRKGSSLGDAAKADLEAATEMTWEAKAQMIPHRGQQILISHIFIWASILLFLDFAALQSLVPALVAGKEPSYFAHLCNWFGSSSCVLWFWGFVILVHWLARIGAPVGSQLGGILKLVAAVFFNLQPMTGVAGTANGAGLWWSNLTGISLFHSGNIVSCLDFYMNPPPGSDWKQGALAHGNLPVTGMWVYHIATWLLWPANLMTCNWGAGPEAQLVPTTAPGVILCQYAGSLGLLLGSLIFLAWANGYRTLAMD